MTRLDNIRPYIYFAGRPFWAMEEYFSRITGVVDVSAGFANGLLSNSAYGTICTNETSHIEVVYVQYDPTLVSVNTLVAQYCKLNNPLTRTLAEPKKNFYYRASIFYVNAQEYYTIKKTIKNEQEKYSFPMAIQIRALSSYFPSEEYFQDDTIPPPPCRHRSCGNRSKNAYKNSRSVNPYRKPTDAELQQKLTQLQYDVTQKNKTEQPFQGEYWNLYDKGIYLDITTGEPLFSSSDKFNSSCGWPSFSKPISPCSITKSRDTSAGVLRTEVRSTAGNAHLGHLFKDGPIKDGGLRYCINSASLRFIPYKDIDDEGYAYFKQFVK